ncbi:11431_t:CDS:2 [Funneliformis geosporum]|nr:11431_t:CDS:2 [Funneliformis geosporum]
MVAILSTGKVSLKLEYRLDDNSSFISLYDLDINPSDTRREYVTFWNLLTNTNTYSSLIYPTSNNCRIGIGWICLNQQQFFHASVTNWILSTRAEIFAFLIALIVFPKNSKVTLFTDSMKITKYIVNQLNLSVTLIKIKGYSSDIYNDIANNLAKSGTQSSKIFINYLKVLFIKCLFQFNDIIIKSSVRHFIKDIFAATAVLNIIDLHRMMISKS